ncbi:MAG: hypothetical protein KKB50_20875, partial [Planctomycetes bacterium]|nr:hypothetical protein [Planctomycetota bacterium]
MCGGASKCREPVTPRPAALCRAALLLEVVIALSIMVAALGLLGAQLVSGLRMTQEADQHTQAGELANRLLALLELDLETQQRVFLDRETDGDFGPQYPGYFWRAYVDPTDVEGLGLVTIEILYQGHPEYQDDIAGARLVRHLHMLKADPARVNLAEDFGVDEEVLTQIVESLPIAGFDPFDLNPQEFIAALTQDPEMLMELLPMIMPLIQQVMGGAGMEGELNPNQLQDLLGGGLAGGGGAGSGSSVEDLLRMRDEMFGGGGGGGRRAGRGGAGGGEEGGRMSTEDLLRMRDEMFGDAGGGGGGRGSGGTAVAPRRGGA